MRHKINISATDEQKMAFQRQMKLIMLVFKFEFVASVFILLFNVYYIPKHECFILNHHDWMELWPWNGNYIRALQYANYSQSDICVIVSTMTLASAVCAIVTVPTIIVILIRKPTIYFKKWIVIMICYLICSLIFFCIGIDDRPTLFGPSVDKTIIVNTIYIIFVMTTSFMALTVLIDRVRAFCNRRIVNR